METHLHTHIAYDPQTHIWVRWIGIAALRRHKADEIILYLLSKSYSFAEWYPWYSSPLALGNVSLILLVTHAGIARPLPAPSLPCIHPVYLYIA